MVNYSPIPHPKANAILSTIIMNKLKFEIIPDSYSTWWRHIHYGAIGSYPLVMSVGPSPEKILSSPIKIIFFLVVEPFKIEHKLMPPVELPRCSIVVYDAPSNAPLINMTKILESFDNWSCNDGIMEKWPK